MTGYFRQTLQRARQERLPQMAGSLAFTTVLSVVPLLAVAFALFTHFPGALRRFRVAVESLLLRNLLPADLAQPVLKYLNQFALNAGGLTAAGFAFLLLAALALMLTVENALNQIWGVKRKRPLVRRLGLHLAMLALGPPLLGVSLWATSLLIGAAAGWWAALLAAAALTALYRWVPNTHVRWGQALVGGVLASAGFEIGKRAFAAYLLKLPTYQAVYGAFAVVPAFLLWVYVSWAVTLAAALVASGLGRSGAR